MRWQRLIRQWLTRHTVEIWRHLTPNHRRGVRRCDTVDSSARERGGTGRQDALDEYRPPAIALVSSHPRRTDDDSSQKRRHRGRLTRTVYNIPLGFHLWRNKVPHRLLSTRLTACVSFWFFFFLRPPASPTLLPTLPPKLLPTLPPTL